MAGKIPLRLDIEPIKRILIISFADIFSMRKRSYTVRQLSDKNRILIHLDSRLCYNLIVRKWISERWYA